MHTFLYIQEFLCMYVCLYIYIAELHPDRLASRLRYNSWNCAPFADVDGITLSTCLMCSAPSLKTRPSPSRSPIRSLIRYREVNSPARQRQRTTDNVDASVAKRCCDDSDDSPCVARRWRNR